MEAGGKETTTTTPMAMGAAAAPLAQALAELPQAQREVLVMRYCQDMPLAEISAAVGRTRASVASLLRRGLRQLRLALDTSP